MAGKVKREPGPRDPADTKTLELTDWLDATRPPVTVGYARVSGPSQSLDLQVEQLHAAGCAQIVTEQRSGAAGKELPELANLVEALRPADTLTVVALDRLGRSLGRIVGLIDGALDRGITVRALKQGLTFTPGQDDAIARATRGLLAVFAQLERDIVVERLAAGREYAERVHGRRVGRKAKLDGKQLEDAKALIAAGRPVAQVAKRLGVGRTTLYRALEAEGGIGGIKDGRESKKVRQRHA